MKTKFLTLNSEHIPGKCPQYSEDIPPMFVPGLVINRETARHKFGGDPMAEYLYELAGDGGQDDETGEVDWDCWVAKFGKRLLFADDQGFVWCKRHFTEELATEEFEFIASEYGKWLDQNDEENDRRETALRMMASFPKQPYIKRVDTDPGSEWEVYIPPTGWDSFDTDGESVLGPYGESYWPTFDAAVDFFQRAHGTTDERTTHNEMLEGMAGREASLTELFNRVDSQDDESEEAQEELDNFPLEISTATTLKVLLSTGGPADWLEAPIENDSRGDYWERVGPVTYHYAPWFDHDEYIVDDDSSLAQYFDNIVETYNG